MEKGYSKGSPRTYCRRGHSLLDPANAYQHKGGYRYCKTCSRATIALCRARRKLADAPPLETFLEKYERGAIEKPLPGEEQSDYIPASLRYERGLLACSESDLE